MLFDNLRKWIPALSLVLTVLVGAILYAKGGDAVENLKLLAGYTILILIFFYGLMVLFAMADGTINLKHLVSEQDGTASMARFQLLIFTFVIGLTFLLIVIGSTPPRFPSVPKEVLILLGISASTYGAGKAIQSTMDDKPDDKA